MNNKELGTWKREGNTVYVLHEREDGTVCNKFSLSVYPDYGGGGTIHDAEAIASRVASDLNQEDLKAIKADIHRLIEKEENQPDLKLGVGGPVGKIQAYSEMLKIINEYL